MDLNILKVEIQNACNQYHNTLFTQEKFNVNNRAQGGKQLNGFVSLSINLAVKAGFESDLIFRNNGIPGYFRISKKWDLVVVDPQDNIVAAIEYKSIGSRPDNVNNRIEEAIGSAIDINCIR